MKIFKIWDIPSVMLKSIESFKKAYPNEKALFYLINADEIKNKIDKIIKDTKIIIIFQNI